VHRRQPELLMFDYDLSHLVKLWRRLAFLARQGL